MRRRHDDVTARGLPYLVAAEGRNVLGYGYCALYRARSAYRYTLEDSVYVKQGLARKGIGRQLLAGLLERSSALGSAPISFARPRGSCATFAPFISISSRKSSSFSAMRRSVTSGLSRP